MPTFAAGLGRSSLPAILEIAENALTVAQLATTELETVRPDEQATVAAEKLRRAGFDAAPVADTVINRFVARTELETCDGLVGDVARIISAEHLVTADLGLADGLAALSEHRFRFVLTGHRISGIVTWSDLQRPSVTMYLFAVTVASEPALDILIRRHFGDGWTANLNVRDLAQMEQIFAERQRQNTEVTRIQCLQIHHRLKLVGQAPELRNAFGHSNRTWRKWSTQIRRLRDTLAHGGNLLDAAGSDPERALELIADVRAFAETAWRLAEA